MYYMHVVSRVIQLKDVKRIAYYTSLKTRTRLTKLGDTEAKKNCVECRKYFDGDEISAYYWEIIILRLGEGLS